MPQPNNFTLLIIINPNSGTREAVSTFRDIVEPMLQNADILYETIYTGMCLFKPDGYTISKESNDGDVNHNGILSIICSFILSLIRFMLCLKPKEQPQVFSHSDNAKDANANFLEKFHDIKSKTDGNFALVCMSGDGTLYEMINFLQRKNVNVSELKLGILPCGTCDGLSTSIFDRRKDDYEVKILRKLMEDGSDPNILKVTNLLGMGNEVLDRDELQRMTSQYPGCKTNETFRSTRAKVKFCCEVMIEAIKNGCEVRPFDAYRASMAIDEDMDKKSTTEAEVDLQSPLLGTTGGKSPLDKNETIDFHCTCWGILSDVDLENENPSGLARRIPKSIRSTLIPVKHILKLKKRKCRLLIHDSSTASSGVPKVVEGDDFTFVAILSCNYIDNTLLLVPGARFDDGYLHVLCCKGGIGMLKAINVFGEIETGEHFTKSGDYFAYYRTRSKVEIIVGGNESDSRLDVCGNGEKPFDNCYNVNHTTGDWKMKNVGKNRHLTCNVLPGYLKLLLPKNF